MSQEVWGGAGFMFVMLVLVVWSLVWKGMSMWRAAKLDQRGWFAALLIINSLGILDILYLYVFSRSGSNDSKPVQTPPAQF